MRSPIRRLVSTHAAAPLIAAIATLAAGCSTATIPGEGAPGDLASLQDGAATLDGAPTPDLVIAPTPDLLSSPNPDLTIACPNVFPTFAKACSSDADCFIALHQINCCGTLVALGYSTSARAAFAAAESTCEGMYPGCGCAQGPTKAEDGRTDLQGTISVRCSAGTCNTYVP
jgi:hypothetical protein